jgi:uncharacterized membrane protein YgcG
MELHKLALEHASASAADEAMDADEPNSELVALVAVSQIKTLLSGEKAQREEAYLRIAELARPESLGVGAQCVGPLMETVFGASDEVVDADELQRAHLVLGELFAAEAVPVTVSAEYNRDFRCTIVWRSAENAYSAVLRKQAHALTHADALTLSVCNSVSLASAARGWEDNTAAAGLSPMGWVDQFFKTNRLLRHTKAEPLDDEFLGSLCPLLLEIVRNPPPVPVPPHAAQQPSWGASELVLAGAWCTLAWILGGRVSLSMPLIEMADGPSGGSGSGMLDVAVAALQQHDPEDRVNWRTPAGILAAGVTVLAWTLSTLELPVNKTRLLLEKGMIAVACEHLEAYRRRGSSGSRLDEANVCSIWTCVQMLATLDLVAPEAAPLLEMLEGIPEALQYMLKHPLWHLQGLGMGTGPHGLMVCGLAFGKEEGKENEEQGKKQGEEEKKEEEYKADGGCGSGGGGGSGSCFEFEQENVDGMLTYLRMIFTGELAEATPLLPRHFLKVLVHMSVSDANKVLLLHTPPGQLTAILQEALLLEPQHPRQDQAPETKAAIQHDAVECFLQLALFEPGREMLAQEHGAMDALRALADGNDGNALSTEAQEMAAGALLAMAVAVTAVEAEGQSNSGGDGQMTALGSKTAHAAAAGGRGRGGGGRGGGGTSGKEQGLGQARHSNGHVMMSYNWDHQVRAYM